METKRQSNKAKESIKLLRMDIIAPLFLKGWTYREMRQEIMARLELKTLSLTTIQHDVEALLAEWKQTRIENVDLALQQELTRIETLVREAWEAWDKSKEDYEKRKGRQEGVPGEQTETTGPGGVVVLKVAQEREEIRNCGDPRYLDTINKLLQEKRKLLGLYSPEKKIVATDLSFANFLMKTGTRRREP